MKLGSIRLRILVGIGALQLIVAFVSSFAVIEYTRHESLAALDSNLASRGMALLSLIQIPEEQNRRLIVRRDLLVLPPLDRFILTDSKGNTVADTPDWTPPIVPASLQRASFYLKVGSTPYRGLIIRDAPITDWEEGEHSPPQNVALIYAAPTLEMDEHLRDVTLFTALAALFMLLFSLLSTFLIVRMGLSPLESLAAQAALVDSGTFQWHTPPDVARVSELLPLSTALSQSIDRLKTAFERERQMFSDAAHELKTAVAIVKSTLQVALQMKRPPDDYRARLKRALDDADRLNALVSGMLLLAAIENHDSYPNACTDVKTAIATVLDQLSPIAQAHGVALRLSPVNPHSVAVPEPEFMLLVTNLIENAIQYSDASQCVDILIQNGGNNKSILTVRDEGTGISEEALPHIFERFFRTDQSRSRETGGFGLGLAMVHAIAVRYQGTVSVTSLSGKGTTFSVALPIAG